MVVLLSRLITPAAAVPVLEEAVAPGVAPVGMVDLDVLVELEVEGLGAKVTLPAFLARGLLLEVGTGLLKLVEESADSLNAAKTALAMRPVSSLFSLIVD